MDIDQLYLTSEKKICIDSEEKIPIPAEVYMQLGQKYTKNIRMLMKYFFSQEELLKGSYTSLKNSHGEIISAIVSNFLLVSFRGFNKPLN